MENLITVFSAFIGGTFLLFGYILQKSLENRRILLEKKRQAYSNYFKAMFQIIDKRSMNREEDRSQEIFWKTQIALYGSDNVIKRLSELNRILPSKIESKEGPQDSSLEIKKAFDNVLLAMRKDTLMKTNINVSEISGVSPILD